jgi:flagellar capping protein FliD
LTNMNTDALSTAQIEQIVIKVMKSHLPEVMEDYVQKNELRAKELALMERVVRVEEELKSLREMSETKFEASEKRFESLQREMIARFEAMDKRFESLQREMNARFEAVDNRFESMDKRFESLQREMNARFESMDKRFSMVQWMIGILVGIPALTFTIIQLVKVL